MKRLLFQAIIPLTIISFITLSKWWYVSVVDGTDEIMHGFPLIYVCRGFHTSMSLQIFIGELLFDLFVYFLFLYVSIYIVNKYWPKFTIAKTISIVLYCLSGLLVALMILLLSNPDNRFKLKRDFDVEVMTSNIDFIFLGPNPRPDYYEYHPERKPIN